MVEQEENIGYARKYRPTSVKGYVGNQDIKENIMRYLKNGRPQSYLLQGASGCGKTTLARIIAKEYCCEDRDVDKGACGTCTTCELFNEYIRTGVSEMLPDVYEVDASEKSNKGDIDSMLESMEYPPMAFEWKIYIIDEAHLMSKAAMGRLLKTLEEPPEGVVIILCTTDPDKLLDTIKNRCQVKCKITRPTTRDIIELLQRVCLYEDRDFDIKGLRTIATWSENVIRDCLNNIETVFNTMGDATLNSVNAVYRSVAESLIFEFYEAYCEDNYIEYANILYKIKMQYDLRQFVNTLTSFTVRGLYILNSVDVDGMTSEELSAYLKLFRKFDPKEISWILSQLRRMLDGDIEANLLSFIYCKQSNIISEEKEITIAESAVTMEDERLMRNSNLEKLENLKFQAGENSVQSELQEVGVEDLGNFFNVEKVET